MSEMTLFVRNIEQAALWLELDGQLSDGHWENARPYDHWKVWCRAKVVAAPAGQPVGRTFAAIKDNYDFTNSDLLDVVALRMLSIVRIARAFGIGVADKLEHAPECHDGNIDWSKPWMAETVAWLHHMGITTAQIDAAIAGDTYSRKDMMRDLRDLKTIIKQRVEARS